MTQKVITGTLNRLDGEPLTPTERDLVRQAIVHYADALSRFANGMAADGDDTSNAHRQLWQLEIARRKIGPGPRT